MNVIDVCADKKDPKALAFIQTWMYWMLGREWLSWMGKSPDSWTASCIDVMQSIKAGFLSPTPEQQNNLRVAITDEGASYLLAVESAINASPQYPPGFESPCSPLPTVFAHFAFLLAGMYKDSRENNTSTFSNYLKNGNWNGERNQQIIDVPAYQPVLPYGNPAGIDPGFAAEPPVKKDDTTTTPPDPGIPAPPPKKDDTTTPPAPAAPGYWAKWGWPLGLGAAALAVVGGVFYFGKSKPKALPGRGNPSQKFKTFEDSSGEYLTLIGTEHGDLILRPTREGIQEAKSMLEMSETVGSGGSLVNESTMLEAHMGNNWEYIRPEEIGALTDATIIARDVQRDDSGDLVDVDRVYAHMNYQVEDPIETWAKGKDVFFQGAGAEENPARGTGARQQHPQGSEIIDNMARLVWAVYWSQREEEKGRSFSQMDIFDVAPATHPAAKKWALTQARKLAEMNGLDPTEPYEAMEELYARAVAANDAKGRRSQAADRFGSDLGHMITGAGVSWFDDNEEFDLKKPHSEFWI